MEWIYLDNNATTQPAPQVVEAVCEAHEMLWANPSSAHRLGQSVRHRIELARASVASLIGCLPREVVFTSGGTESNNLAVQGVLGGGDRPSCKIPLNDRDDRTGDASYLAGTLITTPIEHPSILEPAAALTGDGVAVHQLPINEDARVSPGNLTRALEMAASRSRVTLVSIQWANNETGSIQPVQQLAEAIARYRREAGEAVSHASRRQVLFHIDATQAVGKIPVDVRQIPIDLMTFSAHKFHGPKGIGALYIRQGVPLTPRQRGGPHERQLRGGTENTAGIIGMGVAAQLAQSFVGDADKVKVLRSLRDNFERAVVAAVPGTVIHGGPPTGSGGNRADLNFCSSRLWNTSTLGFAGLESQAVLIGLSERGLCASAGAACSSGSLEPSPVLAAMGVPDDVAQGSVRFSLCRSTTRRQIERAVHDVVEVVRRLNKAMPQAV